MSVDALICSVVIVATSQKLDYPLSRILFLAKQKLYSVAVPHCVKDFEKWQERGIGLYIYSKARGTGKTFLASCICNSLMVKYKLTTKFVSESDLIDLSKQDNQGEKNPIEVLCECKVLVIDDIGAKNTGSEWLNDILCKIIESRYQKKLVTIFTSNRKVNELRIDDRVSSRIDKISQLIPLPEYSYRNKQSHDEKVDFYKELGLM
jgi:DNA replication protein DnaC